MENDIIGHEKETTLLNAKLSSVKLGFVARLPVDCG